MKRIFPESELIINADGSCFHLHVHPKQLADRIILVSDPASVDLIATHFEKKECEVESREFRTITGTYKGKRITCLSYGFGSENIDIVLNELDTLVNVDYNTREERDAHRVLTMVNIGITESVQPKIESGTVVASVKSIGFDGLLNFYAKRDEICDLKMERAFIDHMQWNTIKGYPYIVATEDGLLKRMVQNDFVCGYTVSCIGFYAPQGRCLRLPLEDTNLKEKLASFEFDGKHIYNIDMESASIMGLASLLGHKAMSCYVVDDAKNISDPSECIHFNLLIKQVLDRI